MSKNEKKSGTHFDRRTFLKGVAATGAMDGIPAAHPASAAQSLTENKTPTKSWKDKPDPIGESLISDGGTYDVVVVGGGHAGLLCARVAAMNGASVALIENQAEKGYIPGIGGGQVGTINYQYALDHGAPRIDEGDFLREWARRNVIRHNPRRASYFAKNSGKVLDFILSLADKESLAQKTHMMSCPPKPTVLLEVSGWKFYYGTAMLNAIWQDLLRTHHKKALATIARYNKMCEKGVDDDFGKDPRIMKVTALKRPLFYGNLMQGMFGRGVDAGTVATTGLDTDAEGRVLDSEFKPIEGLYSAGNNAGGRFIVVYQSPFAGISIGMAITDGYLLGERLAAL